LISISKCDIF